MDRTLTAAGARELASRLATPLADAEPIAARHDAVAFLLQSAPVARALRQALRGAPDMARALGRFSVNRFVPRDLAALRDGLARAEAMRDAFTAHRTFRRRCARRRERAGAAELAPRQELTRALAAELPARLEDGGVVGPGYDGELDALRRLRDGARGRSWRCRCDLAQAWGVASLKIRHHQQFGLSWPRCPAAAGETLLRARPAPGPMAPVHRQSMASAHRFTCGAAGRPRPQALRRRGTRRRGGRRAVVRHLRKLCL